MQLLLYIQIKEREAIRFAHPLNSWIKTTFPNLTLLDADNFSDDLVIEQLLKMIQEATACILLLEVAPGAKPGKTTRLLEAMLRPKSKPELVHLSGQNETIEKMLRLTKTDYRQDEDLKSLLSEVLG